MTTILRPAAILAADVAGYSRLMGANKEGTLCAAASSPTRKSPQSYDRRR